MAPGDENNQHLVLKELDLESTTMMTAAWSNLVIYSTESLPGPGLDSHAQILDGVGGSQLSSGHNEVVLKSETF